MSGKCFACGAPVDGDVCDWRCEQWAHETVREHLCRLCADPCDCGDKADCAGCSICHETNTCDCAEEPCQRLS